MKTKLAQEVAASAVRRMSDSTDMSTAEETFGSQNTLFSQTTQSSLDGLNTFTNMGLDSEDEHMDIDENILMADKLPLVSTNNNLSGCGRAEK